MPKMKSVSAAKKRFKKTANGFKRKKAFTSHILTKKSAKRKRQLRGTTMVDETNLKAIKRMLPGV
jgi:large subunit ribosomal protein L35